MRSPTASRRWRRRSPRTTARSANEGKSGGKSVPDEHPMSAGRAAPMRVAHRGAPTRAIENTLRSIRIAEDAGADAIELDVRSPDGVVERIPTFEEVLDATRTTLVVDVKTASMLAAIDAMITARDAYARIVFNGEPAMAEATRRAIPQARILMSWAKPELPPDELLARVRPFAVNLKWTDANAAAVPAYAAKGIAVWCWTVDDPDNARRARDAGVAAIISNDLDAIAPGLA